MTCQINNIVESLYTGLPLDRNPLSILNTACRHKSFFYSDKNNPFKV